MSSIAERGLAHLKRMYSGDLSRRLGDRVALKYGTLEDKRKQKRIKSDAYIFMQHRQYHQVASGCYR